MRRTISHLAFFISSKSTWGIQQIPSKAAITTSMYIYIYDIYVYRHNENEFVQDSIIEGDACTQTPFHGTHVEVLKNIFSCRKHKDYTTDSPRPYRGAANTALIGQETWLLTPAWQKVTWVGLARGKGEVAQKPVFGFVEAEKLIVFVVVQRWELVDRSQILLLCPLWRTHDKSHSRGLGCFGRLVDATDNNLR